MHTEIEAKLKVDSLQEVERKLAEVGAEFLEEQLQTDTYFDDAGADLKNSDRALRLRQQRAGQKEKTFLTYKGAKEKNDFKKRQEIEIEVADGDSFEELFLALGYEKALVFEKKRRVWRLGECEVALDELPLLGCFVEIEGPDSESIADVQKNLGLANVSHIQESYAFLMDEKLHQLGKTERQVFL
ncbi:MAG TPA: class IV adenylate cyclase [Sedimentisphaerales bacterium]|nr:class IV adenylate cyclase [Sedimentisphaerales bacterium]